jgi:monomeric sarcosine oxidase
MPLRVAVIGGGGIGSAAARFLARDGHTVTVIEQFGFDHDRGGSWGSSRIIRRTYADRLYTALMSDAYSLWRELEHDAGEPLLVQTGGLFFGRSTHPDVLAAKDALERNGVPFDVLDRAGVSRRFPEMRLDEDEIAVYEPDAGFLHASACVRANVRLAHAEGATLLERNAVRSISPAADHLTIELENRERLEVDRVVVTTGAWSRPFLAELVQLPLVVSRQVYCHFQPHSMTHGFGEAQFPVWIDLESLFYGFPASLEPRGVKVALHRHGAATTPESVDRLVNEDDRAPLTEYCSRRLPGLSAEVLFEKVCLYANSPDEDFIVDHVPGEPRIVLFAGDSGHAFKFSVLLGRILASMASGDELAWDLSRFSLARFAAS